MTSMDKERRDYLRGFATSRNVVSMSPETVVELLDALEAATERAERAERERDDARATEDALRDLNASIRDSWEIALSERDEARSERDALRSEKCATCHANGRGPCEPACIGEAIGSSDALRAHARKAAKP